MYENSVLLLTKHEQLKSLSDPLRVKILTLLTENSLSGQDISKSTGVKRPTIHYHLKDLEQNGLIVLIEESKKGNMTQKKYKAVARSFIPSPDLLPFTKEYGESRRLLTIEALDRAKIRAISAPEIAFAQDTTNKKKVARISSQLEVFTTKEKFSKWIGKYSELLDELKDLEDKSSLDNGEWFYLATAAFQIDKPLFKEEHEDE